MTPSESLLCALLRGEPTSWQHGDDPAEIATFLNAARDHGVVPLLNAAFRTHRWAGEWPEVIHSTCYGETVTQAVHELARRVEIARVLDALATAGLESLLLKGTGLAYGCYANPTLRPRADTDLLVSPESSAIAGDVLRALGYRRTGGPAGSFVGYQLELRRDDRFGLQHAIDLHWRISNAQSFAWLFTFRELAARAVAVPNLDHHALRLGNAHALMLNLLHRVGSNRFQYPGLGDRLIWHYDIKLLVEQMSTGEVEDFQKMVETKRIGAIAAEGLSECALRFGSLRLTELRQNLTSSPAASYGANLLKAGRLERDWIELRAIPDVRSRLAYLAQRAFPAREYMRERFPDSATRSLAFLHARRLFEGLGMLIPRRNQ